MFNKIDLEKLKTNIYLFLNHDTAYFMPDTKAASLHITAWRMTRLFDTDIYPRWTRTPNVQFRNPIPYPLGHEGV